MRELTAAATPHFTPEIASTVEEAVRILTIVQTGAPTLFVQNSDVDRLRNRIRANRLSTIAYEREALVFNRAYFAKNFFKSLVAIGHFANQIDGVSDIVDVGAGIGTASLAWRFLTRQHAATIALVEQSEAQAALGLSLHSSLAMPGPLYKKRNYFAFPYSPKVFRLFSYWFCEPQVQSCLSPRSLNRLLGDRGLVIDYPTVLARLQLAAPANYKWSKFDLRVTARPPLSTIVSDSEFGVHAVQYERF